MPLTPIEIKKKEFGRAIRGFDPGEVTSFLGSVADEVDRLSSTLRDMQLRTSELERQLAQYTTLEHNIQQALVQAQESAAKTLETVQREASVKLREAELEAARILDNAHREGEKVIGQAQLDISKFNDEISMLRTMRGTLLARIKSFLTQQTQALRELEHDEPGGLNPHSNPAFNVPIDEILKSLE